MPTGEWGAPAVAFVPKRARRSGRGPGESRLRRVNRLEKGLALPRLSMLCRLRSAEHGVSGALLESTLGLVLSASASCWHVRIANPKALATNLFKASKDLHYFHDL
jgi:hypothetical protein